MNRWLVMFLLLVASTGVAQNQLVLLKGEKLLFRFKEGNDFQVQLKNGRKTYKSFIVSVNDTTIISGYDTIPIHQIQRVYAKRTTLLNEIGLLAMMGGTAYFLIDEFNTIVVQVNDPGVDQSVVKASATLLVGGAALFFIRKKSQRIHGRVRLLSVDNKSSFYESDYKPQEGYLSPYIPKN